MALNLVNLNTEIRELMISEVNFDVEARRLYISSRLNDVGARIYESLLREAINSGDDDTFAQSIIDNNCLNQFEIRTRNGNPYSSRLPYNAHVTLCEGEFNRFYIRALCRRVLQDNSQNLEVYRARLSTNPRPDSEAKVGARVDAQQLLNDLRDNIGIDTALGLPNGPNSGLSVRIV